MIKVRHPSDSLYLNAEQNLFKLVHNRRGTTGYLSGVPNIALPDNSLWNAEYEASDVDKPRPEDPYDDTTGWADFEGEFEEIEELNLYFTAFDTANQYPFRAKVWPDVTFGACGDNTYPQHEDLVALNSTRASVFQNGSKGSSSVTLHYLPPSEWVWTKGDNFTIHHGPLRIPMLYKVTRDATTDENGRCSVRISPRLVRNVIANDPITIYRPRTVFKPVAFTSARSSGRLPLGSTTFLQARQATEIFKEPNVVI